MTESQGNYACQYQCRVPITANKNKRADSIYRASPDSLKLEEQQQPWTIQMTQSDAVQRLCPTNRPVLLSLHPSRASFPATRSWKCPLGEKGWCPGDPQRTHSGHITKTKLSLRVEHSSCHRSSCFSRIRALGGTRVCWIQNGDIWDLCLFCLL